MIAHSRPRPELFEDKAKAKAKMNQGRGHGGIKFYEIMSLFSLSRDLFGLMISTLWLNTRSTGAEEPGIEKILSSSGLD